MDKLVLIDGNSIMNRAFYGIMGSKMLTTKDGKYTNAVYGFLAILFKLIEDVNPTHIAVAFDLKAPTARHKLYEGYKATRKGMPKTDVITKKEIDIRGARTSAGEFEEALELIRSRRVDMNKILTKVVSIEEAPETTIDIEKNPGDYMKVVVRIAYDPNPEK